MAERTAEREKPKAKTAPLGAAAAWLGISRPTLDQAIKAGQIRTVVIGRRRRVLVTDIERLLDE